LSAEFDPSAAVFYVKEEAILGAGLVMSHRGRLIDVRMANGSRHFADVPMRIPPSVLRQTLDADEGVRITACIDGFTEAWIDFEYGGHSFSVHNPFGEYWLFVRDPSCPDEILSAVTKLERSAVS
jgi:hypothetical protein